MSHSGIPGPIGLRGGDKFYELSAFERGWNEAFKSQHPFNYPPLEDLDSLGWIEGYVAYVRSCLETEREELRRQGRKEAFWRAGEACRTQGESKPQSL